MRVLFVSLVAALAAACTSAEDWPVRSGNGGPGGTTDAPDAYPGDAPLPGDDELAGQVCVVETFDAPFDCGDIALGRGVQVKDVATAMIAISDNATLFSLPVTTATTTIEVGGVVGDGLHPTQSIVRNSNDSTRAQAAVFDQALWDAMLVTLQEAEIAGAIVVYVVDDSGAPVANATVTHGSGTADQRIYYDDGVGGWDGNETTTGPDGAALMLDTTGGVVSASATNLVAASVTIPTRVGATGIGVITLLPAL